MGSERISGRPQGRPFFMTGLGKEPKAVRAKASGEG